MALITASSRFTRLATALSAGDLPGAVIRVRPVGALMMEDESGGDEKIIAVPSRHLTKRYDRVENYTDLPEITIHQIQHFFEHYKDLEPGKWVKVTGWGTKEQALALVERGIAAAILNSGAYAGLAIGAPVVGWLVAEFGWRESFYVTGGVGIADNGKTRYATQNFR